MDCSFPEASVVGRIPAAAAVFQVPSAPTPLLLRRLPRAAGGAQEALRGLLDAGAEYNLNFDHAEQLAVYAISVMAVSESQESEIRMFC
jgi:hypothetical protein